MADEIARLGLALDSRSFRAEGIASARTLDDIKKSAEGAIEGLNRASGGFDRAVASAKAAAAIFAVYEVQKHAREVLDLAARYQTLGVAMNVVGRNAGYSQAEMAGFDASLRKTGISMLESRNNLAKMAAAQLDLSKAAEMGRVAQDAGVIANIKSSEAFERLIQGIVSGQPRVLHTMGIFADFVKREDEWAKAHGKTRQELSQSELVQIRFDATLAEGAKRAGAYEAAMGTAGKQIKSTERYVEDLKVKIGTAFLPEYTRAVFAYSNALKFANENVASIVAGLKGLIFVGELVGVAIGARMVAGFLRSREAAIDMFLKVDTGRAVLLSSVEAQRGAATAAVARAEAAKVASAEVVAGLEREMVALRAVQLVERQRLGEAVARVNTAVPVGQVAPLGGAVQARDNAAVAFAIKARANAQAELNRVSAQMMATDAELAIAARNLTAAEIAVTEAEAARGIVMARTTIITRAAAAASSVFSGVMAALGGPIGVALAAALLINAALDYYIDKQSKASEMTEAQTAAYQAALDTAHKRAAKIKEDTDAESNRQLKFKETLNERQEELAKLTAVNAAYGASAYALNLLEVRYDRQIALIKNHKLYKGQEREAIDAVTVSLYNQKLRQIELEEQQRATEAATAAAATNAATVRAARDEYDVAGLKTRQAAELRITQEATTRILAAQVVLAKDLNGATASQATAARAVYDATVRTIQAEEQWKQNTLSKQTNADIVKDLEHRLRQSAVSLDITNRQIAADKQGKRAVEELTIVLAGEAAVRDAVNDAKEKGNRLTLASIVQIRDAAEAEARARGELVKTASTVKLQQEITENFLKGLQSGFAEMIERMLTEGIRGLNGFLQAVKAMVIRMFAELIAMRLMQRLFTDRPSLSSAVPLPGDPQGGGGSFFGLGGADTTRNRFGAAFAGLGAGYGAGQALYSSSHGTFGNYARGAIGGAASGAAAGFMIAGPVGAAIGGVAGLVGGILGIGSASREAARHMRELQKTLSDDMASLRAQVARDSLAAGIADIEKDREARRRQIEDAYAGGKADSENVRIRTRLLAEMNALEDQRIQQLKEEIEVQKKNYAEDLQVRLLVAQGKNKDADRLRLQLAQEREYREAVKAGYDDTTLALLRQVQAQEKLAAEANNATTALQNVPPGFKIRLAQFNAMTGITPSGVFGDSPTSQFSTSPPDSSATDGRSVVIPVYLDGKTITTVVVKNLERLSATQNGGDSKAWATRGVNV